jgi:hypothetical protein
MSRERRILVAIIGALLLVCALALSVFSIFFYAVQARGITPEAQNAPRVTLRLPEAEVPDGDFTVEEYPIVAQEVDTPDHLEYLQRISPAILSRRQAWREPLPAKVVETPNRVLAAFGYHLEPVASEPAPTYRLYREDVEIQDGITRFWPVTANEWSDDFALLIEIQYSTLKLVQHGTMQEWNPGPEVRTPPVYYGDELIIPRQEGWENIAVERGGEVLYEVQVEPTIDNPVKGLWGWDGHWVLEVDGQVIIDGQSLNQELGYDEIFGWVLLRGEPFYFFVQDGQVGLSYAGETLPYTYDDVVHDECCEPAAFNPGHNETMVWFHALHGGTWLYVETGVYR